MPEVSNAHKAVIYRHLHESLEAGVPLPDVHNELQEVFSQKGKYSKAQITAVTSWVRSQLLANRRTQPLDWNENEGGPTNEDTDFANDIKNESRAWHMANIAKHTTPEQRAKMRFSVLPGRNDYDFKALQGIGINCRNLLTFILGEDPKAAAEYLRMCRRYGVTDRHVGDMADMLPKVTEPIQGLYWDFFGQACPAFLANVASAPIDPNCSGIPIGINVMKGREHKSTTSVILEKAFRTARSWISRRLPDSHNFDPFSHFKPVDQSEIAPLNLADHRNDVLKYSFVHSVGTANVKQWLLPEHARKICEMVLKLQGSSERFEDIPDFEKYELFTTAMQMASALSMPLQQAIRLNDTIIAAPLPLATTGAAFGVINRPIVTAVEEPKEYVSPQGNRPFVSFFGTIDTRQKTYMAHQRAMEFILTLTEQLLGEFNAQSKDVQAGRQHYSLEPIAKRIHVTGAGPAKVVHLQDAMGNRLVDISHDALLEACFTLNISCTGKTNDYEQRTQAELNEAKLKIERESDVADAAQMLKSIKPKLLNSRPHLSTPGQRQPRNAMCSCGSGLKFKKCCMH
jgi:SEC-C motif